MVTYFTKYDDPMAPSDYELKQELIMPARLRVMRVKCKRHGEWSIMLDRPLSRHDKCKQCFTQLTDRAIAKLGANENDQIYTM